MLLQLLDRYGAAELQAASLEALAGDVPHPSAVPPPLDRRRERRGAPPPVATELPGHVQARDRPVQPHALEPYDRLREAADE